MKVIPETYLMKVIPETYLMKVIPETYLMKVIPLKDVRDSEYPALEVFYLSTKALRDHCLNTLREQGHTYHEEEIKWSVTLPAIWSAEAKMFHIFQLHIQTNLHETINDNLGPFDLLAPKAF
jgi:hypothetical protein